MPHPPQVLPRRERLPAWIRHVPENERQMMSQIGKVAFSELPRRGRASTVLLLPVPLGHSGLCPLKPPNPFASSGTRVPACLCSIWIRDCLRSYVVTVGAVFCFFVLFCQNET